jgi:Domain of unknown function (DUF3597)
MSIFGNIMSSIFGHAKAQTTQAAPAASGKTSGPAPSSAGGKKSSSETTGAGSTASSSVPSAKVNTKSATASVSAQPEVDVEAVLTQLTSQNKEKLDWRRSIVDLMKLLKLDSGLSARKELAKELHYTGNTNDTAAMNVWLHKQVMIKLAENGGKVPDSLKI